MNYKIGDKVRLLESGRGKKGRRNCKCNFGVIVDIDLKHLHRCPYEVYHGRECNTWHHEPDSIASIEESTETGEGVDRKAEADTAGKCKECGHREERSSASVLRFNCRGGCAKSLSVQLWAGDRVIISMGKHGKPSVGWLFLNYSDIERIYEFAKEKKKVGFSGMGIGKKINMNLRIQRSL